MLTTAIMLTLIALSEQPQLGITVESSADGVHIVQVADGSPTAAFALAGDRLASLNGEAVRSEAGLAYVLSRAPSGKSLPIVTERAGVASTNSIVLAVATSPRSTSQALLERRPTTGLGLLIPGAIITGVAILGAIGNLVVWGLYRDSPSSDTALLGAAGCAAFLGAGIPMTVVGAIRNQHHRKWVEQHEVTVASHRDAGVARFQLSMTF